MYVPCLGRGIVGGVTQSRSEALSGRRFALLYILPTVLILLAAVWPLIRGEQTLFLRDTFNTHLAMKSFQAEAMREGYLPLVDPWRGGGQPHLGNPNTVALYPDNLLFLVAPPIWALNAHFWIHWLLAPFAGFWMGRAWGLGRQASWACGVCFAASGFFLSELNLYNLIAGAVLAPALVASTLTLARDGARATMATATALLWALLLLAGDPMSAAMALVLAVSAVAVSVGLRRAAWGSLGVAVGLGTAIAAPQWVEFLRILPLSFRGHWGYSSQAATAASWDPRTALEWLIPVAFRPPDLTFWGDAFHGDRPPLFYSLYPGLVALVLLVAALRSRTRAALWAWGAIALGGFLALGRHNPLMAWVLGFGGAGLVRLPVKFWLLVAVGATLLCGIGFQRVFGDGRRREAAIALGALGALFVGAWLVLGTQAASVEGRLRAWIPSVFSAEFVHFERLRWAGLCLLSVLLLAAVGALLRLARGRAALAGGLLLTLHLATQLFLLRGLVPKDDAEFYRRPPELLARVPEGSLVVNAISGSLFGPGRIGAGGFPDSRVLWLQRRRHQELSAPTLARWHRRAEFASSPEGLDSFLTRATSQAIARAPDPIRLRLLEAAGVDYLILDRELVDLASLVDTEEGRITKVHSQVTAGRELHLYRLDRRAEAVRFVGNIERVPHMNAALARLASPEMDLSSTVVLPGEGGPSAGSGGRVEILASGPEHLRVRVSAQSAGALVVQRSFLPIYSAEVDGQPASIEVADLHRMAIEVPLGVHEVTLEVNRRPLLLSFLLSMGSLLTVVALAIRGGRKAAPE